MNQRGEISSRRDYYRNKVGHSDSVCRNLSRENETELKVRE